MPVCYCVFLYVLRGTASFKQ